MYRRRYRLPKFRVGNEGSDDVITSSQVVAIDLYAQCTRKIGLLTSSTETTNSTKVFVQPVQHRSTHIRLILLPGAGRETRSGGAAGTGR